MTEAELRAENARLRAQLADVLGPHERSYEMLTILYEQIQDRSWGRRRKLPDAVLLARMIKLLADMGRRPA